MSDFIKVLSAKKREWIENPVAYDVVNSDCIKLQMGDDVSEYRCFNRFRGVLSPLAFGLEPPRFVVQAVFVRIYGDGPDRVTVQAEVNISKYLNFWYKDLKDSFSAGKDRFLLSILGLKDEVSCDKDKVFRICELFEKNATVGGLAQCYFDVYHGVDWDEITKDFYYKKIEICL